jgi:type II secretion system protein I
MPNRRGFTLLEAAVAMTIIAFVAMSALGAFAADMRAADRARQLLPAAALAQERMVILELIDGHTLRMLPDSSSHGTFSAPYADHAWTATAKQVTGEPTLVELEVRVTWPDGQFAIAQRRYRPTIVAVTRSIP